MRFKTIVERTFRTELRSVIGRRFGGGSFGQHRLEGHNTIIPAQTRRSQHNHASTDSKVTTQSYQHRLEGHNTIMPAQTRRFSVNLQCGDDQDSSDLALHYDARLNYGSDQNVVVRNHRSDGNFGPEEKDQDFFPFSAGAPFELVIVVEAENYTVLVNGQQHVVFNHRIIPIQRVNHLSILGDVELQEVHIE
ncbi:galectin [Plakobranchus ocellatus]|uniref:Galectin n=1 Tax=Plakobranchus ocellatus TaxID=259542 RepID=A0AAV4CEE2_9GAST|nr:galectin [Plakobranchus ocellatus]